MHDERTSTPRTSSGRNRGGRQRGEQGHHRADDGKPGKSPDHTARVGADEEGVLAYPVAAEDDEHYGDNHEHARGDIKGHGHGKGTRQRTAQAPRHEPQVPGEGGDDEG